MTPYPSKDFVIRASRGGVQVVVMSVPPQPLGTRRYSTASELDCLVPSGDAGWHARPRHTAVDAPGTKAPLDPWRRPRAVLEERLSGHQHGPGRRPGSGVQTDGVQAFRREAGAAL